MTILALTDIIRKETFIYYRREFTARAHIDLPGKEHAGKIEFTIETAPTGKKDVHIKLLDAFDYPVIPVMKGLRDYIQSLDSEGKLP